MKNKTVFKLMFLLVASILLLAGCGQAKIDKADSERIGVIEEKVNALFNDEKDDIADEIEEKQFEEIDGLLEKEEGNEFSEDNALRIGSIILYLGQAKNMLDLQGKVEKLVGEDGVVDEKLFADVKEHVETLKEHKTFYDRQVVEINKVEKVYEEQVAQQKHNDETEKALAKLFTEDGKVKNDVTQEQYDEVAKLVKEVKNEDVKTNFETELKKVDENIKAIAKAEKEEADRKAAEAEAEKQRQLAQQKEQESKQQQSNSVQSNQSASSSNTTTNQQSGKVNNSSSSSKNNSSTSANSGSNNKGTSSNSNKGTSSSNGSGNKSNSNNSSNKESSNSGSSSSSGNKGSGSSSNNNGFMNGMSDKDINDYFNNSDCTHVGSGDIGDGGSYDKYQCK